MRDEKDANQRTHWKGSLSWKHILKQRQEGNLQSITPPTIYGYLAFLAQALPHLGLPQIAMSLLGNASLEDRKEALNLCGIFGLKGNQHPESIKDANLFSRETNHECLKVIAPPEVIMPPAGRGVPKPIGPVGPGDAFKNNLDYHVKMPAQRQLLNWSIRCRRPSSIISAWPPRPMVPRSNLS